MVELLPQDPAGWIDVSVCEAIVSAPLKFLVTVDGSGVGYTALSYVIDDVMQKNRNTNVEVLHIYDKSKEYLPPHFRSDAIQSLVEAKLTSAITPKRSYMRWLPKAGKSVGEHICEQVNAGRKDFIVLGFFGRKGKKDSHLPGSSLLEVLQRASGTAIVIKDEDPAMLPTQRPTKFVVSVSLNKASTKAFLDALRLSQPGDEIHAVYVKSFMERTESDYTSTLREKYSSFFAALKNGDEKVFSKFQDRVTEFVMIEKQRRETTPQAIVRYADDWEADFICVGTNALRAQRGKKPVGSVSMEVCQETERNFIVSYWVDIDPRIYEENVRHANTPAQSRR